MKLLLNLVICEYLFRIRARVLCLDEGDCERMRNSGSAHGVHADMHFAPFDAATITNQTGKYAVIFSNIEPYFLGNKKSSSGFIIYDFKEAHNYLYYALRANFYRAWHQNHLKSIFCLRALYDHAKKLNGNNNPVDVEMICNFGVTIANDGSLPDNDAIAKIIEAIAVPRNGNEMPQRERILEKSFSQLNLDIA